jgi:hypothetical protein
VIELGRKPFEYQTSHRIDQVEVGMVDGSHAQLLLKHLTRAEFHSSAMLAKPASLYNPRREVEAYRLLANAGLGTPVCHDAGDDWVLIEKVRGVELWQVGELENWVNAARWLAQFHVRYEGMPPVNGHLLRYDADYFRIWPSRVRLHHPKLARVIDGYERVIAILCSQPPTFVHGEFYPSNVLVAGERIAPVDWEMAGIGAGVLDLAALIAGWGEEERLTIIEGYGAVPPEAVDAAQLHLSLQWLGWSPDWTPPPEHARDWLVDALAAAERLGF